MASVGLGSRLIGLRESYPSLDCWILCHLDGSAGGTSSHGNLVGGGHLKRRTWSQTSYEWLRSLRCGYLLLRGAIVEFCRVLSNLRWRKKDTHLHRLSESKGPKEREKRKNDRTETYVRLVFLPYRLCGCVHDTFFLYVSRGREMIAVGLCAFRELVMIAKLLSCICPADKDASWLSRPIVIFYCFFSNLS